MRKYIATATLVLSIGLGALAQGVSVNFGYGLRPTYKRPIQKEVLEKARSLMDIIPDYPIHWIADYVSVEVLATGHGKNRKALGTNVVLNAEQKNILSTANLDDDVEINVNYRTHNVVTGAPTNSGMHVVFRIVPETEAEFVGGDAALKEYMREKGIDKISEKIPAGFKQVLVRFTVNEQGKTADAYISVSSGSDKIDQLILDSIKNMPKWKPAENAKGEKVKQEFEFIAGQTMDGC